jgi:hypothetical protein
MLINYKHSRVVKRNHRCINRDKYSSISLLVTWVNVNHIRKGDKVRQQEADYGRIQMDHSAHKQGKRAHLYGLSSHYTDFLLSLTGWYNTINLIPLVVGS